MIGSADTEAEERAELISLREQAVLRRKELGETVAAIAGKLASTDPGAWARQAASAAARRAMDGVQAAAGQAIRSHPWPAVAAGAGACLLVAATAWRVARHGQPAPALAWPARRRPRQRRSRRR